MPIKPNIKILVIDDMQILRKLLMRMLKEIGLTNVADAEDGIAAWKMIEDAIERGQPFEFIISDWNMPNMTGYALLKKVRSTPGMEKIPFLMITAENEKTNVMSALNEGVSSFIIKPFSPKILRDKIDTIFKNSK